MCGIDIISGSKQWEGGMQADPADLLQPTFFKNDLVGLAYHTTRPSKVVIRGSQPQASFLTLYTQIIAGYCSLKGRATLKSRDAHTAG